MSELSQRWESLYETLVLLLRLTVDRFRDTCFAFQLLETKPPVAFLVRIFVAAYRRRPSKRPLLVSMLEAILPIEQKSAFLRHSFGLIVRSHRPEFEAADFLYRCHKTGIFSCEQVVEEIKQCLACCWDQKRNFRCVLSYFDSMLIELKPMLHADLVRFNDYSEPTDEFREFGLSRSSLFRAIELDCVDEVQQMINDTGIEMSFATAVAGLPELLGKLPVMMIEYAVFFASIRCFKFFLLNGALLRPRIAMFAIAGGNTEILRILEDRHISFTLYLPIASLFHRQNVLEWIIEVNPPESMDDRFSAALEHAAASNNCEAGQWFFEFKPELRMIIPVILSTAAENHATEFCRMILARFELPITFSILIAAVDSSDPELLLFFLSFPGPALDAKQSKKLIVRAADRGFVDCLRVLLDNRRLSLNPKASAALTAAARGDRNECIVELLRISGINVNYKNREGKTILHVAVEIGNSGILQTICGKQTVDLNVQNRVLHPFPKEFPFGFFDSTQPRRVPEAERNGRDPTLVARRPVRRRRPSWQVPAAPGGEEELSADAAAAPGEGQPAEREGQRWNDAPSRRRDRELADIDNAAHVHGDRRKSQRQSLFVVNSMDKLHCTRQL
jgi:hypothetical protein